MTIPTDIQLGLLERKVGPIVTQRVGDNCNKRYKELHVIGKHKQISCFGWPQIERNPKSGRKEHQYLHLLIDPNNGEIIEENFGIEEEGSNIFLGGNAITKYSDTPERDHYKYWEYDLGDWKKSSYITHMHMGIPLKID